MNHTMQNHWPRGKHPQKCKGQKSQKASGSSGMKKADKKGKGNKKAQASDNVLDIVDIGELSITSSESINFSCYKTSETVEWFLDNRCTDHITPRQSDFVQYRWDRAGCFVPASGAFLTCSSLHNQAVLAFFLCLALPTW